jgi:CRISPR/Cas system CSM-associated protein Csm2 small subunit
MPSNEKYKRRWESHIDDLTKLKWNLATEDQERVEALQDELKDVLDVAAENKEEADKKGLTEANFEKVTEA